ncbi:MAG: cation-translocating P-type ATPase, partial [Spirochaetota bacterium]
MPHDQEAYTLTIEETVDGLDVNPETGLSPGEAGRRLAEHGPNELQEKDRPGILSLLIDQFNDFLILILVAAAAVSFAVGEPIDAGAILVIVVLNAIVGVVQEYKAEQALAALKEMSAPDVDVRRDGERRTIEVRSLVPGDIVVLEAGSSVPADLRLVESVNLRVDEAALTGESVPVQKKAKGPLEKKTPLGDRANMAFKGTSVAYGRGLGVVTATGMATEMGRIADMIQSYEEEQTPLQKRLSQLGRWLGIISLSICGVIFVYGVVRDTDPLLVFREGFAAYMGRHQQHIIDLFMTAVSLAIAAVPEGLPAVVTICLALGMKRMVQRNALIRKLPAVETLGTATVICSDKTGTLTQNEMTVVKAWVPGREYEVSGQGYDPHGEFRAGDDRVDPRADARLSLLVHGGTLCNDAGLREGTGEDGAAVDATATPADDATPGGDYDIIGDPTEGALVVAGGKAGLAKKGTDEAWPRVDEFPFTSGRKRMTTVHRVPDGTDLPGLEPGGCAVFMKGAPDVVLRYCDRVLGEGAAAELTDERRDEVLDTNRSLAKQALRVLAVAYRGATEAPEEDADADDVEHGLVFVGLAGMIDPARPEATEAVRTAKDAGIRTVMVTGDYPETAGAI